MLKVAHIVIVTRKSIPGVLAWRDEAGRDERGETKHLRALVGSRFLLRGSRGRLVLVRFPRRTLERSRRPKARVVIDVSVDADRSNLKMTLA